VTRVPIVPAVLFAAFVAVGAGVPPASADAAGALTTARLAPPGVTAAGHADG
jgi:hypothetical protein